MSVTIRDVAAMAGVSPSTVSRTCKNNSSISEETKKKVRAAMSKLGYEPNFKASNLASQNSRTIGIILPVSERTMYVNSFFLEIIRGITQYCNSKQYITTIITGESEKEVLQTIRSMIRNGLVDSFIFLYSKKNDPVIDFMHNKGILYALIGNAYQFANQTIYVDTDNISAGKDATEYLIRMNHNRIGFIGYEMSQLFSADRKYGYELAHLEHNLPLNPDYYFEIKHSPTLLPDRLTQLLQSSNSPTAFVVADDFLAVALEHHCQQYKLSVPDDLSIVSFNNSLFAQLASTPVTSIDINSIQLGIEAATQIIKHLENPALAATKTIVPHKIVERESITAIQ